MALVLMPDWLRICAHLGSFFPLKPAALYTVPVENDVAIGVSETITVPNYRIMIVLSIVTSIMWIRMIVYASNPEEMQASPH